MTQRNLDFYFDVVCPYAYLAFSQIGDLCRRHQVELSYRPILLGGLYRVIGAGDGPMPTMAAAKARLNLLDMQRWAEHLGVPLKMPATHPNRTVLAMRTVLAAGRSTSAELANGAIERAAQALYAAYWGRGENLAEPAVVQAALTRAGFDGEALLAVADDPAIKQALRDAVDDAAAIGAFGVPTFMLHVAGKSEMYWGQDRLALIEAALLGHAA